MAGAIPIDVPGLEIDAVEVDEQAIRIKAHSISTEANCPDCGQASSRVHSWYQRHPVDLPCIGQVVHFIVSVQRFFCVEKTCQRRTFVEPLSPWLQRSARRTSRLNQILQLLALAMGGELGARVSKPLAMHVSEVTFLRLIRQQPMVTAPSPRVLGVDDWAIRKGERYGTILVDLEAHRPIDLLPDREADSLANWLRAHSGVEIISRDRGTPYIDGATKGAPQALQVADRWHLLHNLREAVQEVLEPLRAQLTITGEQRTTPENSASSVTLPPKKRAWAYNREERYARYQKMVELAGQGLTNQAIARAVGVSITTVRNYLAAGQFPEWQPRPLVSKWLSPYLPYLQQRWDEGCHNSAQLWRELCQQGYCRSRALVYEYVARLRQGLPTSPDPIATPRFSVIRRYSPRQASWLLVSQPDDLDADQARDLGTIRQRCPDADRAYHLAQAFGAMIRERQVHALQPWMRAALDSTLVPFRKFVFGLHRDLKAVRAALSLPWSNGQTEGQVNRLKLIKRHMYGRANFDLLRLRVLLRC